MWILIYPHQKIQACMVKNAEGIDTYLQIFLRAYRQDNIFIHNDVLLFSTLHFSNWLQGLTKVLLQPYTLFNFILHPTNDNSTYVSKQYL